MRFPRRAVLSLLVACAFPAAALAAPMLSGPLRIVVPYGPGGGLDGLARPLVEPLSKRLGVPVIIDNRPGASTKIGTSLAAGAPADGRTLVMMSDPGWVGYYYEGIFDFKPWATMTPVAQIASSPYSVYVVKAQGEVKNWADLIAKAKKAGKPLLASAPAAGGFSEMAFHEIARQFGVEGVLVPYPSAGPARMALLSGEVDMQVDSLAALAGFRNSQTRGIAISTPKRLRQASDVPTFNELGLKVNLPVNTFSLWGPAGMDKTVVDHIAEAVREAIKEKAYVDAIESGNLIEVGFKSGDEIRREVKMVEDEWGAKLADAVKAKKK